MAEEYPADAHLQACKASCKEPLLTMEEADPRKHDELTQRYCCGWAVASAEYRKDIKKLYAELPGKEGWQGKEIQELREAKWKGNVTTHPDLARRKRDTE